MFQLFVRPNQEQQQCERVPAVGGQSAGCGIHFQCADEHHVDIKH